MFVHITWCGATVGFDGRCFWSGRVVVTQPEDGTARFRLRGTVRIEEFLPDREVSGDTLTQDVRNALYAAYIEEAREVSSYWAAQVAAVEAIRRRDIETEHAGISLTFCGRRLSLLEWESGVDCPRQPARHEYLTAGMYGLSITPVPARDGYAAVWHICRANAE